MLESNVPHERSSRRSAVNVGQKLGRGKPWASKTRFHLAWTKPLHTWRNCTLRLPRKRKSERRRRDCGEEYPGKRRTPAAAVLVVMRVVLLFHPPAVRRIAAAVESAAVSQPAAVQPLMRAGGGVPLHTLASPLDEDGAQLRGVGVKGSRAKRRLRQVRARERVRVREVTPQLHVRDAEVPQRNARRIPTPVSLVRVLRRSSWNEVCKFTFNIDTLLLLQCCCFFFLLVIVLAATVNSLRHDKPATWIANRLITRQR